MDSPNLQSSVLHQFHLQRESQMLCKQGKGMVKLLVLQVLNPTRSHSQGPVHSQKHLQDCGCRRWNEGESFEWLFCLVPILCRSYFPRAQLSLSCLLPVAVLSPAFPNMLRWIFGWPCCWEQFNLGEMAHYKKADCVHPALLDQCTGWAHNAKPQLSLTSEH